MSICGPWEGAAIPFDSMCGNGFDRMRFAAPVVRCSFEAKDGTTLTPLIVDLDGDKKPEILVQSFLPVALTALRGSDCSVYFSKPMVFFSYAQIAAADLDGDGLPEIVGSDSDRHVVVLDNRGNRLAVSKQTFDVTGRGSNVTPQIVIADVDRRRGPEIVVGTMVLRFSKVSTPPLDVIWSRVEMAPRGGPASVVADLDGDGKPEVVSPPHVFDGATGADRTPPSMGVLPRTGGYAAVADFNGDKRPDLVVVQQDWDQGKESVAVYDFANQKFLFGPLQLPDLGEGPPTVADFDGDGRPEIATATQFTQYVIDLDCAVAKPPAQCSGYGILWSKVTKDWSSWSTSSAAFDFNGDGAAELVYRDECWLRVYNGADGKVLFGVPMSSQTGTEGPAVADVDGDGHAEIVVTSDSYDKLSLFCPKGPEPDLGLPWTGYTKQLFVLADPWKRWMPTRRVWNQHAYHITNVNDDLSVPIPEPGSWLSHNSYRAQPAFDVGKKLADLTASEPTEIDPGSADCAKVWTLRGRICNRGAVAAPAGVAGSFYSRDPRLQSGGSLCVAKTAVKLAPGTSEVVACDWKMPGGDSIDLWFRADDDGQGVGTVAECHEYNNLHRRRNARCVKSEQ